MQHRNILHTSFYGAGIALFSLPVVAFGSLFGAFFGIFIYFIVCDFNDEQCINYTLGITSFIGGTISFVCNLEDSIKYAKSFSLVAIELIGCSCINQDSKIYGEEV